MRRKTNQEHSIDMLFLVVIFLIFTFAALSVLLLSVNFYRETVKQAEDDENSRGATAYIREVVHQNDVSGGVSVSEFDGIPCLMVSEDDGYVQYIYYMDGELKELYTREDANVSAGNGQKIMALAAFMIEEKAGGIIEVTCTDESGFDQTVMVSKKSQAGGADQ